ncbi:MAG: carboxypeptidase-like regulatory domain-containing protein, partial [Planctomycetota bacterium]
EDPVDTSGLTDLWPGFALVEVLGPGGLRCVRELELGHRKPTLLALDLGDHGRVHGVARDADAVPLAGVRVTLDGFETRTDRDGRFVAPRIASGQTQLVARLPGFVSVSLHLRDAEGRSHDEPVALRLERGLRVAVSPDALPGGDGGRDVELYLLPGAGPLVASRAGVVGYPWYDLNPLRVPAGGRIVIDDLPRGRVDVRAFHPLARGEPTFAWLSDEDMVEVAVALRPLSLVHGVVRRGGEPVPGARLELRYANPFAATQQSLGSDARHYKSQPIELLPHVVTALTSDAQGRFTLGLDPAIRKPAYLVITSADGALILTRRLDDPRKDLVIDLSRPEA